MIYSTDTIKKKKNKTHVISNSLELMVFGEHWGYVNI